MDNLLDDEINEYDQLKYICHQLPSRYLMMIYEIWKFNLLRHHYRNHIIRPTRRQKKCAMDRCVKSTMDRNAQ